MTERSCDRGDLCIFADGCRRQEQRRRRRFVIIDNGQFHICRLCNPRQIRCDALYSDALIGRIHRVVHRRDRHRLRAIRLPCCNRQRAATEHIIRTPVPGGSLLL